jgi:arylsulfatase A-like enzyme
VIDPVYRRALGTVWAFLAVGLLVKFAELLFTFEHRAWLSTHSELARRAGQIRLTLQFSWQEFAIAAALMLIVLACSWWRPQPGRGTRRTVSVIRVVVALLSLISVFGISYYAAYHTHPTVDDLEHFGWAPQLLQSASASNLLSVRLIAGVWLVVVIGLPWLFARQAHLARRYTHSVAALMLMVLAAGLFMAGRPNLAEAKLEPNPVAWMVFGRRVSYHDLAHVETLAPIGPHSRAFTAASSPRNVIVVVLESTPAAALSAYDPSATGGQQLFEEFASDITVFDDVFAVQPNSTASIVSVLTGHSPVPTAAHAVAAMHDTGTLSEVLTARGYHSEFLLNGPTDAVIDSLMRRQFVRTLNMHETWPNQEKYARVSWGADDRLLFDEATAVLERTAPTQPVFLYLHTNNPHHPYTADHLPAVKGSHDPKVRHRLLVNHTMDALTDFYRRLKASGLAESTMVIAYGDHGEAFGEHEGNFIHSKELYKENLHVPMLLLHPGRLGLPARIKQLGSLDDLTPTVLDILGMEPGDRHGMSLLFEAPERLLFSMTDWGPGQVALRDRQFLYVLSRTGRELLFDRLADPEERTNLIHTRADIAAAFRSRLTSSIQRD